MKITRRGYERNHGPTTVVPETSFQKDGNTWENSVRWDAAANEVVLTTGGVKDPSGGQSQHVYYIRLQLEDVATLVKMLGQAASEDNAAALRDSLNDDMPALVRLLACAANLVPSPIPSCEEAEAT